MQAHETDQPAQPGKAVSWLSKVFKLNTSGLNWPRAVMVLDVILVPMVVFWAIGHEEYLLSAMFGALFAVVADPGGAYGYRAARMAVFGLIGAGVTALGFSLGGARWGWLVLAASPSRWLPAWRLCSGYTGSLPPCSSTSGSSSRSHSESASISTPTSPATPGLRCSPGPAVQRSGSRLTFVTWLICGRRDMPQPVAEIPGDTSTRKLTRPIIAFAVIRALAIAGTVAHRVRVEPVARRLAADRDHRRDEAEPGAEHAHGGAARDRGLIGAGAAALLLLIPASEHGSRLLVIRADSKWWRSYW